MSKKEKAGLVPRFRFPEFRDSGEWGSKSISELLDYERPDRYIVDSTNYNDYGVPVLTANKSFLLGYTEEHHGVYTDVPVIIFDDFTVDYKYVDFPFKIKSSAIKMLKPKAKNILKFVYELMGTIKFEPQEHKRHYISVYQHLIVGVPNFKEQKKITDCLSSLDDLINAENKKLALLKAHKKGLMQKLFPAEGKTVPELRFPVFRDDDKWKMKMLGQFADVVMCKRIFANETNENDDVPFYKISTLGGKADAFISQELFEEYKLKYSYPKKGEILITCSGTIGKCVPYNGEDAYYQDSNIVWIDNPTNELRNEFLLLLLSNVNWSKLNSTTITRIYGSDLRNLALRFPKNEKEQQKITSCLSALDKCIIAQADKIENLKVHKIGLMQGLFPSVLEVIE